MNSVKKIISPRVLSTFALVMITVTSVDSIRNLPATALFGSALIFFFLAAAILFLIPTALVSAELATGWPKKGGVYIWVKEAFGEKYGFLAIWFQWIENVIWYPTILSFIAGTLAYIISPGLANNPVYMVSVILGVFWGVTFINLRGVKLSARFSIFCGIAGLFLPMALIIILGGWWILDNQPLQITFTLSNLFPNFSKPDILVALTGVILCFCGIEIATVHAQEVDNPQHDYPKALLFSTLIIVISLILSSLAIAIVVPNDKLSLVAGIMQAFDEFFKAHGLERLLPLIALSIIIGGLGGLSNWIIAPSRGLLVAMRQNGVAKFLHEESKSNAPVGLLIYQAIIVSIISLIFLFMPTINSSYWILTALAAQLYMFMYILMFAAGIYLRYKCPNVERAFKIPGGKLGIWIVCGIGILTAVFIIVIGFVPPAGVMIGSLVRYECLLVGGIIIMSFPPFILYGMRKKEQITQDFDE